MFSFFHNNWKASAIQNSMKSFQEHVDLKKTFSFMFSHLCTWPNTNKITFEGLGSNVGDVGNYCFLKITIG
jgi:hypothetical protein